MSDHSSRTEQSNEHAHDHLSQGGTAHAPQARQFESHHQASHSTHTDQSVKNQDVFTPSQVSSSTFVQPSPVRNLLTGALVFVVLVGVFGGLLWIGSRLIQSEKSPAKMAQITPTASPAEAKSNPIVVLPTMAPMIQSTGTSSPTPSARPTASPTPTATAKPTATPNTTSSLVDLNVESIYIEDPQTEKVISAGDLNAGLRIRLRAVLKNSGTQDAKLFRSYWVINGNTVGVNSNGKVGASRTAIYDDVNSLVSPEFFIKSGVNTVSYFVDSENVNNESNTANNVRQASFSSQPTKIDLSAEGVNLYELNTTRVSTASAGKPMTMRVSVKNVGTDKISGFGIRLQQNNATVAEATYNGWLSGGQTSDVLSYNFTPSAGSTTFKISLNIDNSVQEMSTGNNTKEVTVTAQ